MSVGPTVRATRYVVEVIGPFYVERYMILPFNKGKVATWVFDFRQIEDFAIFQGHGVSSPALINERVTCYQFFLMLRLVSKVALTSDSGKTRVLPETPFSMQNLALYLDSLVSPFSSQT